VRPLAKYLAFGFLTLGLTCAVLYAGLNVVVVNVVTVVHPVVIAVEVRDDASSAPIAGADVGWASIHGSPEKGSLGATDVQGAFRFHRTIQQQPSWMWPTIGTLDLNRWVLRVEAPGYRRWIGDLGPLLPDLPLANPVGTVRVRLRRA
jgi:hypothetical protein